jgi:photosystem II stability/assembly factor-like uncharacterized protein
MKRLLTLFLSAGFLLAAQLPAQALNSIRSRPVRRYLWHLPECDVTRGHPAVILSRDGGATLAGRENALRGIGYTFGLVALDTPNTLLAVHNESVLKSIDAGCSWNELGRLPGGTFPPFLIAAPEGKAYGWSPNRETFFALGGDGITVLRAPVEDIAGVGVDAHDALHLRLVGGAGMMYESTDGGASWAPRSAIPIDGLLYKVVFDPQDLDHAVAGTTTTGGWVTFDGGRNWTQARGFSTSEQTFANVFNLVFSPADGNVVWAMGLDLSDQGGASKGRHIYRSVDGGRNYTPVVDRSAEVTLVNGPVLAAHPTDRDVLLFFFGTYFQNYGTDIFTYNAATQQLRTFHHAIDGIDSVAFHPLDPSTIYFGAEVVQGTQ